MAIFPRHFGIGRTLRMPLRALLYRRPSEPPAISVTFDREIYLVRVRRHRQARRYTLRIQSATREVVLTMPPRGSLKQAREFAEKHGGWIAARRHGEHDFAGGGLDAQGVTPRLPVTPHAHQIDLAVEGDADRRRLARPSVKKRAQGHAKGPPDPEMSRKYCHIRRRSPRGFARPKMPQ